MSLSNSPSQAQRDALVQEHLPYARKLAAGLRRELSLDLDLEELCAWAANGLLEAAERYDPTRGVAFTTFSYYRIRGAMIDGLRRMGWLGRSAYARFQAATDTFLQQQLESAVPTAANAPLAAGEALHEIADTLNQVTTIFLCAFDENDTGLVPDAAPNAGETLERREANDSLRAVLNSLPEKERQILELVYFQDLSLTAAGERLGLGKSWSSRLHSRAIRLLTAALKGT